MMPGGGKDRVGTAGAATLLMIIAIIRTPTYAQAADPRVDALSSVLREITGQLERINNVYINKLEKELSSSSAKMSSLEATVRSIADRAAAWDNIQNHMAVWTDQSRTMERKMDILNRCHEKQETWETRLNAVDALNHKLTALDKKINAMTRLEFKVEQVSERVEEVDSKINWIKKQMNTPGGGGGGGEQPIINEFAGRGILSSLLNIETKLDNFTTNMADGAASTGDYSTYKRTRQVYGSRFRQTRPTVEPEPGITFTYEGDGTCQLHPRDSRRLQDVSAKVDLVFDRVTDPDYDYDLFVSHLPRASPLSAQSFPPTGDPNEPSPEHLFARFWKSLFSPFKKINRRFRGFETQLESIQRSCNDSTNLHGIASGLGDVLQQKLRPLDQALREEMEETRLAVNDQNSNIEKVAQAVSNTAYMSEQLLSEIKNQFQAQRIIFQEQIDETQNLFLQHCAYGGNGNQAPWEPREPSQTPAAKPTKPPQKEPYQPSEPQTPPQYPVTQPPVTQPPVTRPPVTRPPVTRPPVTRPPVTRPPVIPFNPPVTESVVSSRHTWIQPPEIEPNIRTLQGERTFYRNRHRLAYKYNDRPRVKTGRTNRKFSKRRKSNRSRRGKLKRKNGRSYPSQDKTREHLIYVNTSQSQRKLKHQQQRQQQHTQVMHNREAIRRQARSVLGQSSTTAMFGEVRDCSDLIKERLTTNTLYNFASDLLPYTEEGHDFYTRYCDMETDGGGWTVIQRRGMFGPPFENFTMSWNDYKIGFGDLKREFWWGNDNIYQMVHERDMTIRFDLWDFEGNYAYAEYLTFRIGDEENNYKLNVFGYKGNASDSFSAHNGYLFSTYDRDNDEAPDCCPCAPAYGGGWWFYSCFESNLNGEYHTNPKDNDYYRGIIWELWLGDYSLKATEIKIRPADFSPSAGGGQDPTLPSPEATPYPTAFPDPYPTGTLAPELPLRQPLRRA